jgi:penicillin-binding protein 1A
MRWIIRLLSFLIVLAIVGTAGVLWGFWHFGKDLPDYAFLEHYEPPVVTRVHDGNGRLVAEFAKNKRVFVPIEAIPNRLKNAFLAAEDKDFYSHPGVDFFSLASAIFINAKNYGTGRRPVGASTITQQVAKNFLLTNEVSYKRKAKEAILALRIERVLDKDRILELYLNEIYLGLGSYGVAAAALNYFDKSLDQLTIADSAYLAALPKAPNNYHPFRKQGNAVERRNWVVEQMRRSGFITEAEARVAADAPLGAKRGTETEVADADFFIEDVRRDLLEIYGEDGLYGGGLSVRTTIDPDLQYMADQSLRWGLEYYDRRHGWRGPLGTLPVVAGWGDALKEFQAPLGLGSWRTALVLQVDDKAATIGFADGTQGTLPLSEMTWAGEWRENQRVGGAPSRVDKVLNQGDVIPVEQVTKGEANAEPPENTYALRQIPDVSGALVALDPHTGRVLAMSGGYDPEISEFNRATQAKRQPGSAFKPFVYLAGLDHGFTPATKILDAPFVYDQGPGLPKWKPTNYSNEFYGPTPMRVGIEKSRNLMTVRLADQIGMPTVVDYAERFGIFDNLPPHLSFALGAAETTPLRLTAAYGMLVNGGKKIETTLIDRIQNRNGVTVYRHDVRPCPACNLSSYAGGAPPVIPDTREQIADPASAYQITSMLRGVVLRGTGRRIAELGKPLAGKTGTTNDNFDTWFVGFSPDLAVGVFVGFDQPRTLGPNDTGSSVAAPIFKHFMEQALANQPSVDFRIPPGVRMVWIDRDTGLRSTPGESNSILEGFKPGTEPTGFEAVIGGGVPTASDDGAVANSSNGPAPSAPVVTSGSGLY